MPTALCARVLETIQSASVTVSRWEPWLAGNLNNTFKIIANTSLQSAAQSSTQQRKYISYCQIHLLTTTIPTNYLLNSRLRFVLVVFFSLAMNFTFYMVKDFWFILLPSKNILRISYKIIIDFHDLQTIWI